MTFAPGVSHISFEIKRNGRRCTRPFEPRALKLPRSPKPAKTGYAILRRASIGGLPLDPEFIRELFAQFRPVTMKRMFGGAGLYAEGLLFALVFDGAIFLKVDETSIPEFEREGSRPFVYTRAKSPGRVGRHSLSYWRLPERLYDDPDALAVWAARALVIAQHKKSAARPRAKQRPASKRAK
jgi:DNA transformation protein and related proteins